MLHIMDEILNIQYETIFLQIFFKRYQNSEEKIGVCLRIDAEMMMFI
jgi:hypothetical protein